ncbi:hypothetical protein PNE13_07340, partial [Escherichia coli]|nr:hypothetical protein [Escherichia coli]
MSERKDSKSRRNYLVKCSCPNSVSYTHL